MLRFLTAGESHGPCLTGILEGMPAGLAIDLDAINEDLRRRQGGYGRGGRQRIEQDRAEIVGGVVTEGQIALGKTIKILRRDNEIARGKIVELQEQKLPTKEVGADRQFGAAVEVKVTLVAGDVIEAITIVQT